MIKFPWIFRAFAVVNIFVFIFLAFQSIVMYYVPGTLGLEVISITAASFTLVASFFWFFGARHSFTFLLTNAIVHLTLSGAAIYLGFEILSEQQRSGVTGFIVLYVLINIVYATFLCIGMYYKPVVAWKKAVAISNFLPFALLLSIFIVSTSILVYLNENDKLYIVVENANHREPLFFPEIIIDLKYLSEIDGIILSRNYQGEDFAAVVSYSTEWEGEDFYGQDTVLFSSLPPNTMRSGESLSYVGSFASSSNQFATIPTVTARKIKLVALNNTLGTTFRFSVLHSVKHFDYTTSLAAFILNMDQRVNTATNEGFLSTETEDEPEVNERYKSFDIEDRDKLIYLIIDDLLEGYDNPYQYRFNASSPRITIKGKSFGLYKDFNSAIDAFIQPALSRLYDYKYPNSLRGAMTFEEFVDEFTGVSLKQDTSDLPFTALNPEFIEWMGIYMLPNQDSYFYDVTLRQIYAAMFKRNVWMLLCTNEYLTFKTDFAREAENYQNHFSEDDFHAPYYLHERYSNVSTNPLFEKFYKEFPMLDDEEFYFNEDLAIGFWLRRKLDGTEDKIFKLLVQVVNEYDQYPFEY